MFKVLVLLPYCLNFTDPLIIPMNLLFLSCHEKADENKDFSRKTSKPNCESQTMTC